MLRLQRLQRSSAGGTQFITSQLNVQFTSLCSYHKSSKLSCPKGKGWGQGGGWVKGGGTPQNKYAVLLVFAETSYFDQMIPHPTQYFVSHTELFSISITVTLEKEKEKRKGKKNLVYSGSDQLSLAEHLNTESAHTIWPAQTSWIQWPAQWSWILNPSTIRVSK